MYMKLLMLYFVIKKVKLFKVVHIYFGYYLRAVNCDNPKIAFSLCGDDMSLTK